MGAARMGKHRTEPDPLAEKVGHRIRALRHETEFAFDAFVEQTGLGRGYISELERGLVVPTIGVLARVADALEITMADLVLGDTEREKLFAEVRGQTKTFVQELRARVREHRDAETPPKTRKPRRA
jgi:transcriptional regulator with XRE-family HTH domain